MKYITSLTQTKSAKHSSARQKGFTIVELMVSLGVLSTILLFSTAILIQIGALYTKGVNAANLQSATRAVTADVSGALQFSGSSVRTGSRTFGTVPVNAFCIDKTRYSFVLKRELGSDPTAPAGESPTVHVLWRDRMKNANDPCEPVNITVDPPTALNTSLSDGGYELAPTHTRLTRFVISPVAAGSEDYNIDAWMVFGDTDLWNQLGGDRSGCNGGVGNQYCSVSELSTVVTRRLE